MKRIFLLYIATLSALLCGCNRDVFINDYAPSAEEIKLSDTDSTVTVSFKASNWDIMGIYAIDEYDYFSEIRGDIYDKDGQLIATESPFHTAEKEAAKMIIDQSDIRLTIERTDETHLRFSSPENMNFRSMKLAVNVGNDYNTKNISVELVPSSRYEVDSIVYALDSYTYQDSVIYRTDITTLTNATSEASTHYITPYSFFLQEYTFTDLHIVDSPYKQTDVLKIFKENIPTVPAPETDRFNDDIIKKLVMKKTTIRLNETMQYLPVPEDIYNIYRAIPINPHKKRICIIECWYGLFGVDCDIYVSQPKSG